MKNFDCVVFPGQGSQRIGMGLDFIDEFPIAKKIFQKASDILSFDLEKVISTESPELNETQYTQPAIFTVEIAMYESLKEHFGLQPKYFGGHSLGEYSALCSAGVIPFEISLQIVAERGRLMQNAIPPGVGSMIAVIMEQIPYDQLKTLAGQHDVDIANDNSSKQIVLSGKKDNIDTIYRHLMQIFQSEEIRIIPLEVSAPFHSRYMKKVEHFFQNTLEGYRQGINLQQISQVVSNYLGNFFPESVDCLFESLTHQISSKVSWKENMTVLSNVSSQILEIGPSRPLSGFFKSIGISISSVINIKTANRIASRA